MSVVHDMPDADPLDAEPVPSLSATHVSSRVAIVGNPNSGKTSLFNVLTGLRARAANYPGITVDLREALIHLDSRPEDNSCQISADVADKCIEAKPVDVTMIDLPGQYGLEPTSPEEQVAFDAVHGRNSIKPDVLMIVLEATNLSRSLFLASELLDLDIPSVIVVNMIDEAEAAGVDVDIAQLEDQLGSTVITTSARTGQGLDELRSRIASLCRTLQNDRASAATACAAQSASPCRMACAGCSLKNRHAWVSSLAQISVRDPRPREVKLSRLDRILTSPTAGLFALVTVMIAVFLTLFWLADLPMSLIEGGFANLAEWVGSILPVGLGTLAQMAIAFPVSVVIGVLILWLGDFQLSKRNIAITLGISALTAWLPAEEFRSLIVDGVIGGVAGVLVFLPQICLLFFFITLLEDSGYMARGAFVMERIMRRVGLPGKAFVPMLSSHACAIPGIIATRSIENWRDRLVTILVLPLLTCSARLPVYAMVAALLFGDQPVLAALMFTGAYCLGVVAALGTAFVLKKSILPGEAAPLVIELPRYRRPSMVNALLTMRDRAMDFVRNAGSIILLISIILWATATFPRLPESMESELRSSTAPDQVEKVVAQEGLEYSIAGRVGKAAEPIFAPLGFDWKINVGVFSSFAAREVVVSTLSVIYGMGEDGAEEEQGLVSTLRSQTHADGSPVFDLPTSLSFLVFYVLAMQCLPTQAVTKRETGSWKWAIFQLVYMTLLAYFAALIVHQVSAWFVTS